ncbi:UbiD family decarboxylase [Nocardia sp. NPDC002869]|uniref:UbiD family decarboxylase n=1 Tax=Nocardia sp. NPDC002869 TaxID=3161032 RepID=UPI00398CB7A9
MIETPDLRGFLNRLRELGELSEIDEQVDWDLEMGAITRYSSERGEPAVLFNRVRDTVDGMRALGIHLGASKQPGLRYARIAVALGLPESASASEIVAAIVAGRSAPGMKPVVVDKDSGRIHVRYGTDIEIDNLPLPYIHDGDGGRYLNTLGVTIMRSPDGEWTNWSVARVQAIGGNRAVGVVAPFQHIGKIHKLWADRGLDMPVVLCMGVDPLALFAGGGPLPDNVDEVDFLGAYTGRPIELEQAETNDLLIPVSAELVLEGSISQSEVATEGPMGEYVGLIYQASSRSHRFVFTFDKLAYRDNAIVPFDAAGEPPEENHTVWGVMTAAESLYLLREAGLPITDAWVPFEAVNNWLVVSVPVGFAVQEDQDALLDRIGDVVFHSKAGFPLKSILVVTDDLDIHDPDELIWALATRHSHSRSMGVFHNETIWAVSPFISGVNGQAGVDKVVFNLLPPPGGTIPPRTKFEVNYPPAVKAAALQKLRTARDGQHA